MDCNFEDVGSHCRLFIVTFPFCCRKNWLTNVGSPKSKISGCNFSNEREINKLDFSSFEVDRSKDGKDSKTKSLKSKSTFSSKRKVKP